MTMAIELDKFFCPVDFSYSARGAKRFAAELARTRYSWLVLAYVLDAPASPRLRHVLIGSVAEKVVRHAPCHVLVTRDRD